MLSKELVSQSQSEKCQFHIFPLAKFIFRNISLLQSKSFLAIPVAMVTIIRNVKKLLFCVCIADVYYVKYV